MRESLRVGYILQSIRENVIPAILSYNIFYESFTTFPKALGNDEANILSTLNTIYITFVICFFCVLRCILWVHWYFIIYKRDQIWHALDAAEGTRWRSS